MKTLILLSLILSITLLSFYIINIMGNKKPLRSISESDYWLRKPFKWTFEAIMFLTGISLLLTSFKLLEHVIWTLFVSGLGIIGVGIFSRFKKNLFFRVMHTFCALIGMGALIFSMWFCFGYWYFSLPIFLSPLLPLFLSDSKDGFILKTELMWIYLSFICLYVIIFIKLM